MKRTSIISLLILLNFLFNIAYTQTFAGIKKAIPATTQNILEEQLRAFDVFEINTASIQNYLGEASLSPLNLSLENAYTLQTLLERKDILDANYNFNSIPKYQRSLTFQGSIDNGQEVQLTVDKEFIYGYFQLEDYAIFIEPLRFFVKESPRNQFIVYKDVDVIETRAATCAVEETQERQNDIKERLDLEKVDECYIVRLAIASDKLMFDKYGNVNDIELRNIAIMNNVQGNYRFEFADNIEFLITEQVVIQDNSDPFDTQSTDNSSTILSTFRNWGNSGGFSNDFDLGQLWSAVDFEASTVGRAYRPGICSSFKYHVLSDYTTNSSSLRVLTSHEIGHNFSIVHDASGSPFIMAPSVTITNDWSANSISQVNSHIAGSSCQTGSNALEDDCTTQGAPQADFVASTKALCAGFSTTIKDNSAFGETRSFTFSGGNPSTSTTASTSVTYNTIGSYSISITSTNGVGSDMLSKDDYILVQNEPNNPCTPSGATGGGGVNSFTINGADFSNSSENAATAGKYENWSCTKVASLAEDSLYTITVGLGDCSVSLFERATLYIDYNGDGNFNNAEEKVAQTNSFWCGTISIGNDAGLQFTTPSNVVKNQLLRMRLIVDNSSPSDACHNPSSGQVEDYSVFFEEIDNSNCPPANLIVDDNVAEGDYIATETIETMGMVNVIGEALFQAGSSITLAAGFHAQPNSTFSAVIEMNANGCAGATQGNERFVAENIESRSVSSIEEKLTIAPNPSRAQVQLSFTLPKAANTSIELRHLNGQLIQQILPNQSLVAGQHTIEYNTTQLEQGMYFVVVRTKELSYVEKIVVLK